MPTIFRNGNRKGIVPTSTTDGYNDRWSSCSSKSTKEVGSGDGSPSIFANDVDTNLRPKDATEDVVFQSSFYTGNPHDRKKPKKMLEQRKSSLDAVLRAHSIYDRRSRCLLNHQGRFVRYWDVATMTGLVYTAIVTPVEVALLENDVWSVMFCINLVITFVFLIDMILQFFLPYETEGTVGISTVTDHKRIATHYLKGWFFLDFCSVLPLDTIGSATGSESMQRLKIVRFLRLLRLLKMIRLLRASRIFARWQTILAISYTTMSLWKFGLMLIMGAHWLGCLWGLVGLEQDAYTWVDALAENKPNGMMIREPFNLYLASMHFAVMTITSIGYGDIIPQQRIEYILAIFIQCLGGMLWAYSMGEVMVVVSNLNPGNTMYKQRMDELNRMMRERRLPKEMRRRLRSFFIQSRELNQADRYTTLLMQMSPQLQGEVARTTNMKWISKVWYLRPHDWYLRPHEGVNKVGISDYFVARIAVALNARVYAQTEAVRSDDTLSVLMRGLASCRGRLLRNGETWGEDFILEHRPLRRLNIVVALTFIEVQELQRHVFQDILEHHASHQDYLMIRKAVVKLAFIRGVVLHARHVRVQRRFDTMHERSSVGRSEVKDMFSSLVTAHEALPRVTAHEALPRHGFNRTKTDAVLQIPPIGSRKNIRSSSLGSTRCTEDMPRMEDFKKEMRAIIRSEIRDALGSRGNNYDSPGNGHRGSRHEHRAPPSAAFGNEIVTLLRMPTDPDSAPSVSSPRAILPGQTQQERERP